MIIVTTQFNIHLPKSNYDKPTIREKVALVLRNYSVNFVIQNKQQNE